MSAAEDHSRDIDPWRNDAPSTPLSGFGDTRDREQAKTRAMVRRAIAEGRIAMVYQPVVDARCLPQVAFHEALIRLQTPGGRLIAPGQFLPAVAGTPLAAQLDRIGLAKVLAQLRAIPEARLSINVGVATLEDPTWLSMLSVVAGDVPDVPYRLIVEVTEDPGFLGHPQCAGFLAALRMMGVSVAVDDFGTGATGFSCFRTHRFDILKIDGSYGDGLAVNPDSQALVRALVEIGRHFEMLTVIEYIDNTDDAACAVRMGVDCLQGYLFGKASPEIRLDGWGDGPARES